jgi:predicted SprT family Zn-dependent metalloprotease
MNKTIEKCKQDFKQVFPDIEIPKIEWNNRLKLCGGRIRFNKRNENIEILNIELNKKLLDTEEKLESTLKHELAHLAELKKFGKGGHGNTWAICMKMLGLKPNIYHNYSLKNLKGYHEYKCSGCPENGTRYYSTRKKNRIQRGLIILKCTKCKTKIKKA